MTHTLMTFLVLLILPLTVSAATRLGPHYTQEELTIWRTRMASGPYRVQGDAGHGGNSPGDWTRISGAASTSPGGTWAGNTTGAAWPVNDHASINALVPRSLDIAAPLEDTALTALVIATSNPSQAASYRTAVRNVLISQAGNANTKFANTTLWPLSGAQIATGNANHVVCMWLRRLTYAYSYIRADLSGADQTTLDTWFTNAGIYWERAVENHLKGTSSSVRFPNYPANYNNPGAQGASEGLTHIGGYPVFAFTHQVGNNKVWNCTAAVTGIAGLLHGTSHNSTAQTLKNKAKLHLKTWLRYAVFPDGTISDQKRWNDSGNVASAWNYASTVLSSVSNAFDDIARMGDMELYETFSTSDGLYGTAGGSKTFKKVLDLYAAMCTGVTQRYATNSASGQTAANRIDPDPPDGQHYVHEISMARPNMFYQDPDLEACYKRNYPDATPNTGGYGAWGGDWGTMSGVLFLHGNLEGLVNPYISIAPPNQELVGEFLLNNTVQDSSGAGNHGTNAGVTFTTTTPYEGTHEAVFDASSDLISIPTLGWSVSQGTISLDVTPSSCPATDTSILMHTTLPAFANRWQLYMRPGCLLSVRIGGSPVTMLDAYTLTPGVPAYITVTWSSGNAILYVNGVQRATGTYVVTSFSALNSFAHIGNNGSPTPTTAWQGNIDVVRIRNRAFSAQEVAEEYSPRHD